jgi:hypothetical protein
MKRFLLNSLLFLVLFAIGLYSRSFYLLITEEYKNNVNGYETYNAIAKSKQKKKTRKVLLGDSVGRQLFENTSYNDTVNSFACNQAIGLVGHYLLLNNFLEAGNQVDTVYMIFTPSSFLNNLDEKYTFHYFLKPFYKDEYKPLFTQTVFEQIRKIPFNFISQDPALLTSNWAPNFNTMDEKNYTFLSPISAEYLKRIKDLSIQYGFKLIILPSPVSMSSKTGIAAIDKSEISKNGLSTEFENYFDRIIFLNDTSFMDGVHLSHPETYTQYYKEHLIKF